MTTEIKLSYLDRLQGQTQKKYRKRIMKFPIIPDG